jgi:hypothetical protein
LDDAGVDEGEDEGVAGALATGELAEEGKGEEDCRYGSVEGYGVEADGIRWDAKAPGEGGGKACIAAFGEVAEGEEGPDEGGARGPGVERIEEREMAEAEVEDRDDHGKQEAGGGERRDHQKENGVGAEAVQVGGNQQQAREDEGREDGEETRVPELFGIEAYGGCGSQAETERRHEAYCGEDAEGGKEKMTGVKEIGMHGWVVGSAGRWICETAVKKEDRPAGPYVESLVNPS